MVALNCDCGCEAKLESMLKAQNAGLMGKIYNFLGIALLCAGSAGIGVLICKLLG